MGQAISSTSLNVVYLGMLDIMMPMLLIPDFTTIYAIDNMDEYTFEGIKFDIKDILIKGNDGTSFGRNIYGDDLPNNEIHYIKTPCTILSDIDAFGVWKLQFLYNDKFRNLIYYHNKPFNKKWPDEINNIRYIFGMNSDGLYVNYQTINTNTTLKYLNDELFAMFQERTLLPFYYFGPTERHASFTKKIRVKCGREREGSLVSVAAIKDTKNFWWKLPFYDATLIKFPLHTVDDHLKLNNKRKVDQLTTKQPNNNKRQKKEE